MRLDVFLKTSRLMPRRSLAQEFCDAGLVNVNGARAKSSKEIKPGDEIEIRRRDRVTKILVSIIPESKQVPKNAAASLYDLIEETKVVDDLG
jgi:ribosomal 50S subunit-recycling heat shock protein